MDREMRDHFSDFMKIQDAFLFRLGSNTFFIEKDDGLYLKYITEKKTEIEYKLKNLDELYEGSKVFAFKSDDDIENYLLLLESIESAIDDYYENHEDLKDKNVKFVLEMLMKNPQAKFNSELAVSIQNNLRLCLSFNPYSKKEVTGSIKRIIKSLQDHHMLDGSKGYLDFLKDRLSL